MNIDITKFTIVIISIIICIISLIILIMNIKKRKTDWKLKFSYWIIELLYILFIFSFNIIELNNNFDLNEIECQLSSCLCFFSYMMVNFF